MQRLGREHARVGVTDEHMRSFINIFLSTLSDYLVLPVTDPMIYYWELVFSYVRRLMAVDSYRFYRHDSSKPEAMQKDGEQLQNSNNQTIDPSSHNDRQYPSPNTQTQEHGLSVDHICERILFKTEESPVTAGVADIDIDKGIGSTDHGADSPQICLDKTIEKMHSRSDGDLLI